MPQKSCKSCYFNIKKTCRNKDSPLYKRDTNYIFGGCDSYYSKSKAKREVSKATGVKTMTKKKKAKAPKGFRKVKGTVYVKVQKKKKKK